MVHGFPQGSLKITSGDSSQKHFHNNLKILFAFYIVLILGQQWWWLKTVSKSRRWHSTLLVVIVFFTATYAVKKKKEKKYNEIGQQKYCINDTPGEVVQINFTIEPSVCIILFFCVIHWEVVVKHLCCVLGRDDYLEKKHIGGKFFSWISSFTKHRFYFKNRADKQITVIWTWALGRYIFVNNKGTFTSRKQLTLFAANNKIKAFEQNLGSTSPPEFDCS